MTWMYLTHSKGKFVVAEWFVRTLKNKIYKCINSKSKNSYIDRDFYIDKTVHVIEPLKWSLLM